MSTWAELSERFRKLAEKTGRDKTASYDMSVVFGGESGEVLVHLFTYDIGDWARHTYLGPFLNEEEALMETSNKIDEAYAAVASQ